MELVLAPSRLARCFIAAGAFATLLLVAFVPGDPAVRAAIAAWSACVALHAVRRHRRGHEVRITAGTAIAVDGVQGRIVSGAFVAPWLTIVHWRPEGACMKRTLLVLPDACEAEGFRALRVILRWYPPSP